MIELDTVEALANVLEDMPQKALVTVDGTTSAGKSTLAAALATSIGAAHLDLDNFLIRDQNAFVEAIRINDLTNALGEAGVVILSGICADAVLALQLRSCFDVSALSGGLVGSTPS